LADDKFRIWRQTRTGLLSYPVEIDAARGHLVASIYLQMSLKPHIVHIVGHTEADHAATSADIIEAANLARRAIENAITGQPDMSADPFIKQRREQLVAESNITIQAIKDLSLSESDDPLIDPQTLSQSVKVGIMDAPHLRNNQFASGKINTRILDGSCVAVDLSGNPLNEQDRINQLIN